MDRESFDSQVTSDGSTIPWLEDEGRLLKRDKGRVKRRAREPVSGGGKKKESWWVGSDEAREMMKRVATWSSETPFLPLLPN